MARGNLRFDRSVITLEHASARGRVLRNADNFTRGSQLIGHQFSMFRAGLGVPVMIWLAVFVVIYWLMLSGIMGEHEIQLCAWRIWSAIWSWVDLDPLKPMNIVLADGSLRRTSVGYIPYVPDVAAAWHRALRTLVGALAASFLIALPLVWLFVTAAHRRGSTILQERHERGATLVERAVLLDDIVAHNAREFEAAALVAFPEKSSQEVIALGFAVRRAAGLHHPYSLAGIPYPYGLEQSHTMIVGTTGAGKTTQMRDLVAQMRARGDSAVIFDLTGAYVEAFYEPLRDVILNPGDARCPTWSLFDDCTTQAELTAASQSIVPHDGGSGDPFWVISARNLFVQTCLKLQRLGLTTNRALAINLMLASLKQVHKLLKGTTAEPYTNPDAPRLADSVRAVFNANAEALVSLPEHGPRFSIREWIRKPDKDGSILFVTARHVDLAFYKMLLTLWLDIAVTTLMTLPRTPRLRTWFMFDELGALHRLPTIEHGLQTARGFGGAVVLGMHSFARLQAVYGREGAENLTSLARTKLILSTGDRKTAEQCTEFIGHREVRQMDEAYSYGYNNLRDASTLTPKKEIAPLVIPDDITNLPALHGFVKFPDGFPAARIVLRYVDYPEVARGFVPRTDSWKSITIEQADIDAYDEETGDGGSGIEVVSSSHTPKPEQMGVPTRETERASSSVARSGIRADASAQQPRDRDAANESRTTSGQMPLPLSADDFGPVVAGTSASPALPLTALNLDSCVNEQGGSGGESPQATPAATLTSRDVAEPNEVLRQQAIAADLATDFGDEDLHHHHVDPGTDPELG